MGLPRHLEVSPTTFKRLKEEKKYGETFDALLNRLMDIHDKVVKR